MIGSLKPTTIDVPNPETGELVKADVIAGHLHTMRVNEIIRLVALGRTDGEHRELFAVECKTGNWPAVGMARKSVIERGDNAGKDMLSIWFDEPELQEAFPNGVSAFPSADGWEMRRDRPRQAVQS